MTAGGHVADAEPGSRPVSEHAVTAAVAVAAAVDFDAA